MASAKTSRAGTRKKAQTPGKLKKSSPVTAEIKYLSVAALGILLLLSVYLEGAAGFVGLFLERFTLGLFGFGAYALPFILIGLALYTLFSRKRRVKTAMLVHVGILFWCIIAFTQVIFVKELAAYDSVFAYFAAAYQGGGLRNGGLFGALLGNLLRSLLGGAGAYMILLLGILITLALLTGRSLSTTIPVWWQRLRDYLDGFSEEEEETEAVEEAAETPHDPPETRRTSRLKPLPTRPRGAKKAAEKKGGIIDIDEKTPATPTKVLLVHEEINHGKSNRFEPFKTATPKPPKRVEFIVGGDDAPDASNHAVDEPLPAESLQTTDRSRTAYKPALFGARTKTTASGRSDIPIRGLAQKIRDLPEDEDEKDATLTPDDLISTGNRLAASTVTPEDDARFPEVALAALSPGEILSAEVDFDAASAGDDWNMKDNLDVSASVDDQDIEDDLDTAPAEDDWDTEDDLNTAASGDDWRVGGDADEASPDDDWDEEDDLNAAAAEDDLSPANAAAAGVLRIRTAPAPAKPPATSGPIITRAEPGSQARFVAPSIPGSRAQFGSRAKFAAQVEPAPQNIVVSYADYQFPSIELLSKNPSSGMSGSNTQIYENSRILEETLRSFRVEATVVEVSVGPTVTRYDLAPGPGVKVAAIANLTNDLALSLAAQGIRIEAPIPGKSAVGIEIPNKEPQPVYLREILEDEQFQKFPSKLAFGVGKDIAGSAVVTDVARMPHLLIAGATGSGKSVCMNTLIVSILYKAKPDEVKLLMIDPKVVELSVYNGIPHLLVPVVTDPKKASAALQWAVTEMDNRYGLFAEAGVRDLKGYNAYVTNNAANSDGDEDDDTAQPAVLPQIVIIIDELADLMMVCKGEVEESICRLAQKARAAGLHLIVATQRPSVDVITGLIKANIPSRLAFAVSSGTDSRTVLDMTGAEKLLGKGDMLFLPMGKNKPIRLQGGFISEPELEGIVGFLKAQTKTEYPAAMVAKVTSPGGNGGDEDLDEFFEDAIVFLIEKGKASTSMLQRQFRIGYNRASRLMEDLETRGIVGPEDGVKPRKVMITWEDYEAQYQR